MIALVAVTLLTVLLSALFSSPDVKPATVAEWAASSPRDFLTTALSELDGTSGVATYGPPYTHVAGAGQNIVGGVSIQRALGVQIPVDPANAFVLGPLSIPAQTTPALAAALAAYRARRRPQQQAWTSAFGKALSARPHLGRRARAAAGASTARPGPDGAPARDGPQRRARRRPRLDDRFYQTDFTKSLLFLSDGSYLEDLAAQQHLLGRPVGDDERDRAATRGRRGSGSTPSGTRSRRSRPRRTPTRRSGRSWRSSRWRSSSSRSSPASARSPARPAVPADLARLLPAGRRRRA